MTELVSIDAAGYQKAIVKQIREQNGDYVLCVKGNQKALRDAVASVFEQAGESEFVDCDMTAQEDDAHGRVEGRYVTVIQNPKGLPKA